jgi:hypothetical protein
MSVSTIVGGNAGACKAGPAAILYGSHRWCWKSRRGRSVLERLERLGNLRLLLEPVEGVLDVVALQRLLRHVLEQLQRPHLDLIVGRLGGPVHQLARLEGVRNALLCLAGRGGSCPRSGLDRRRFPWRQSPVPGSSGWPRPEYIRLSHKLGAKGNMCFLLHGLVRWTSSSHGSECQVRVSFFPTAPSTLIRQVPSASDSLGRPPDAWEPSHGILVQSPSGYLAE